MTPMKTYVNYNLSGGIIDACAEIRKLKAEIDSVDTNETGSLTRLKNLCIKADGIMKSLQEYSTFAERRAIEEQNLIPYIFEN